jgi:5-methylcytosine-specific restriction endonuclease McrA
MPRRALSVCPTSGCPELTTGGRCAACRSRAEKVRGSGGARGSTRRWQAFSKAYIAKHPACLCMADWCARIHQPGQCDQPSTDPDHIDGTGRTGPRAYDPTNLRPLCHACHARKTVRMDGGFGR